MNKMVIAGFVSVLAFTVACGLGDGDPQESVVPTPPLVQGSTSVSPPVDDGSLGAGVYEVGKGIAAGKWETKADINSVGCYWQRSKDASGAFESIIANGTVPSGGPGIVQVVATDKFVTFTGDCRWRKTG